MIILTTTELPEFHYVTELKIQVFFKDVLTIAGVEEDFGQKLTLNRHNQTYLDISEKGGGVKIPNHPRRLF